MNIAKGPPKNSPPTDPRLAPYLDALSAAQQLLAADVTNAPADNARADLSGTGNGGLTGAPVNPAGPDAQELQKILGAWAGLPFDTDLARQELLHELFEQQAAIRPDQIAATCAGYELTYAELDRKSNQLARFLRARGVGRGGFVAMLLPRSLDVYVALLAIMKAGAAYVPLDPDYPEDRVSYILADCGVQVLLTTSAFSKAYAAFAGPLVELDTQEPEIACESYDRIPHGETGTLPEDLCYVIYTSGSTGRPKGVQIEHRSVCNLVRAEARLFQVTDRDRVYQGFSIAFDASVEEVWLAFFAGATLVAGTSEMVHAGAALSGLLAAARVTVLSCVPTLLSMMEEDVPTVRLLILGGEQCPHDLVQRWCKPGRRMFNTYGPTEATVIATWTDCDPQKPVTIGRPVPNYYTYILDSERRAVPAGVTGELYLGGVALSRGYVGRDDLTRERFVPNPYAAKGRPQTLYRTGDLARFTSCGDIEFMGRADGQVKLRGFRVELSEIECVLLQCPGVLAAAVCVREDVLGLQQLVGYIVRRENATFDEEGVRLMLRSRLPAYMVPAILEVLAEFPTLTSGKVDRKRLPAPQARLPDFQTPSVQPRNACERQVLEAWQTVFSPIPVSLDDNFFLDLGGHSLLAARMVSALRKQPRFQNMSMLDVYNHPTVASLAARFEPQAAVEPGHNGTPAGAEPPECLPETRPHVPSRVAHFFCGAMQLVGLYVTLGFFSLQWLAPYLTYSWMHDAEYPIAEALAGSLISLLAVYPVMLLISLAAKWTVIGRFKAGHYPLWGVYYFRWWFVNSIVSSIPIDYLAGTPLLGWYYRLMGARIGTNVYLGTFRFSMFDLLTIGDDSSIGIDASLVGYTVEDGLLKLGPVSVGNGCCVGTRSVLREHATMQDGSRLDDLSLLPRGTTIPRGQRWRGSPAAEVQAARVQALACSGLADDRSAARERERKTELELQRPTRLRRAAFTLLHAVGVFLIPMFVLCAIFPGMMLMTYLNAIDDYYYYLVISPLVSLSFVVFLCLEIAVFKWVLLGRVKAGCYKLHSWFYVKKWFVDQLLHLSLDVVGTLYSTIYLAPWYRLLGAKLGKRTEVSTASFISPDLLSIDDESFIADSVSLGAAHVANGTITIGGTRVGKRSFIGNSAILPPGSVVGNDCLIGCLSAPPPVEAGPVADRSSWLGSPAFFLPQRQKTQGFSDEQTFHPTRTLWLERGSIELLRVILPPAGFISLTSVLLSAVLVMQDHVSFWQLLLVFPLLYAKCAVVAALAVVFLKWALMGRYKPCERPLWSPFVWRTELVTALYEHLACLFLVEKLKGTPFICWFQRLLGARIGRRVYMETTEFTEFDLVTIGNEAALNADCTIQTHLFEDRVMKMSHVRIGDRCTVGGGSLVLYDTHMEDGSSLNDLSLLMKGEVLPPATLWEGIPARCCRPVEEAST